MISKEYQIAYSVLYNLFLITLGSAIFGLGVKGIAAPRGLITGSISGLALLVYYWTDLLTPGVL